MFYKKKRDIPDEKKISNNLIQITSFTTYRKNILTKLGRMDITFDCNYSKLKLKETNF